MQDVGPGLINSLMERIEQLSLNLERMKLAEYVEMLNRPWRLFYINFMSGLARGLGIALGFTVLSAVVLIVLQRLMVLNLPGMSGFIAEIVRAGVLAVPRGQSEAAAALGLHRSLALRLIVVPQALRLITPPLTSQYLNIVKNSSLAVFVGYPDLVLVFAGTVLNQTHAAMQVMAVTMAVYLAISLVVSFALNLFDARNAPKER